MRNLLRELLKAIRSNYKNGVETILKESPALASKYYLEKTWLHIAAENDAIDVMNFLVEFGFDVNIPKKESPFTPLHCAAGNKAYSAVKWLIKKGANLNKGIETQDATPIVYAIMENDLKMVKLLYENGATIDFFFGSPLKHLLTFAKLYNDSEIISFLKSKISKDIKVDSTYQKDEITKHIEKHLGKTSELALTDIISNLKILLILPNNKYDRITLITNGLSKIQEEKIKSGNRYCELLIYLPKDWPIDRKKIFDKNYFWPIEWLRKVAFTIINKNESFKTPSIITNGEPPQPLGPNTKQSSILILSEQSKFGEYKKANGKIIEFFTLIPIYTEEKNLELMLGTVHLLKQFHKFNISKIVELNRINVGLK